MTYRIPRDEGEDPIRLIEVMIEKGWQSIELEWIKGKEIEEDGLSKFLRRHAQNGQNVGESADARSG